MRADSRQTARVRLLGPWLRCQNCKTHQTVIQRHKTSTETSPSGPRAHRSRVGAKGSGLPETTLAAAEALPAEASRERKAQAGSHRRGQQRATRRRAARARRRRPTTPAQHAPAAPPVRPVHPVGAQRVRRLAPFHVDGGVAPARRPRLAPALARSWERRANSRDSGRAVAVEGRRPAVDGDAGEADAEPTTEFQRDASTKAPGDGSL